MSDEKKGPYNMQDDEELFDEEFAVASATECTGLMPAAPATEPEVRSYSDIYDIPLAKDPKDAQNGLQNVRKTTRSIGRQKPQ